MIIAVLSRISWKMLILGLCCFLTLSCQSPSGFSIDQYEFTLDSDFKKDSRKNDSVALALSDDEDSVIIIQKKMSAFTADMFDVANKEDLLKLKHVYCFNEMTESRNPYEKSKIDIHRIGGIDYSKQSFKTLVNDLEMEFDVRLLKLEEDFYPVMSFAYTKNSIKLRNALDQIIKSLDQENQEE